MEPQNFEVRKGIYKDATMKKDPISKEIRKVVEELGTS